MKPAVIVVFVGLPASGKSTFAKLLKDALQNQKEDNFTPVIVEHDILIPHELQKQLSANSDESKWKAERKVILDSVDNYLSSQEVASFVPTIANRNDKSLVLIIDDNNYYSSMRYEYFQVARKHEIGFVQFHFDVDVTLAKTLNSRRDEAAKVPEEVIDKMAVKLEPPNPLKNTWEQFSFKVQVESLEKLQDFVDLSLTMVKMALVNPVKAIEDRAQEREKDRAKCTASVIHQADKCLRKLVGGKIKEVKDLPKESLKEKADLFNAKKDELLEDLKTGFKTLPSDIVTGIGKKEPDAIDKLCTELSKLFDDKIKEE